MKKRVTIKALVLFAVLLAMAAAVVKVYFMFYPGEL